MASTDIAQLHDPTPRARVLSNGRYHVLLSGAGTGYSSWGDTLLTAWEGDRTEDGDGLFIYLHDLDDGATWSVGAQPMGLAGADAYAAMADDGVVAIERRQHAVTAALTTCVWPDLDGELRRLVLRNDSPRARRLAVTVYAPLVLNQASAHAAHPAFSKLFVETEHLAERRLLLARRRPRAAGEHPPLMGLSWPDGGAYSVETDRARFLGRNRSAAAPLAGASGAALSGTVGSVLDPAFALREVVVLPPGATLQRDLLLAAASQRDALLALLAAGAPRQRRDRATAAAAAAERERCAHLGLAPAKGAELQELAAALLYQHPRLRAPDAVLRRARGALSQIWAMALGGRPLAVGIGAAAEKHLQAMLGAHAYWHALGLGIDLLLVTDSAAAAQAAEQAAAQQTPGVVVRARGALAAADLDVALAWASVVSTGAPPRLRWGAAAPPAAPAASAPPRPTPGAAASPGHFDNGIGGFSPEGDEYVIRVGGGAAERPPLAWINVVANEHTGFLASESGAGYTWSRNSREHRTTAWGNDPISDPHSEALYLRDEASGDVWSPQPGPCPAPGARHEVRHGFGYTRWRSESHGLAQEVVQFVPRHDPVKITRLRVTNTGGAPRRLAAAAYARLVLGVTPRDSARLLVTAGDRASGALLARNLLADEFADGEAFAAVHPPAGGARSATTDRTAFLGRNGSPAAPLALRAAALDGTVGAGLDPCFALLAAVEVPAGATVEWIFLLGEAVGRDRVRELVRRYADGGVVEDALSAVRAFWRGLVGAVRIRTPAPAIDVMVNGWLLYQVVSCRIWGRTALYQSGGAFGFRDQLQDAAALLLARPELTRQQILLHAAHQFVEGDVLHWWHPPLARGIRTRFSDDLLWLPFVTAAYIDATGDHAVLHELAGYVEGRLLAPGEDESYFQPAIASERTDLYEHCCRAIDRSLTTGAHGLPLMGTGDWNDGMNRVGRAGRGESVWVAFFLYDVLGAFAPYCAERGDHGRAERYAAHRRALGAAIESNAWDGEWYRRAYYDDGTPLGSVASDECRIDAIAQAWAVISGAARTERAAQAMEALERQLVDERGGLIRLLTPPFDRGAHDPGYIKGYVPGIRENGGQYTHGAMWAVQAFAMLGRRDRAAALLEMLSPVTHGGSAARLAVYQVEPYVVVADIYGVDPHLGRGGWTWYTGSAGWMYRIAVERLLGVRVEAGTTLAIDPRIPDAWPGFEVALRLHDGATRYTVAVENPHQRAAAVTAITLDGVPGRIDAGIGRVALLRDGAEHLVRVALG
ncbi:glycosyl transferase [bacterium]|nr:glycosyl transferase [bacterium]